MKKLNYFLTFFLVAAVAVFVSSCDPETEDNPPTISQSNTLDASYLPGDVVTLELVFGSQSDLETITILTSGATLDADAITIVSGQSSFKEDDTSEFAKGITNAPVTFEITLPEDISAETEITLTFKVTNDDDLDATKEITVTVMPGFMSYTTIIAGAQDSEVGSFLSVMEGIVRNAADAKENDDKVDIVYYYGTTTMATLAAPNDADLQTYMNTPSQLDPQNATLFKTGVSVDFATASLVDIKAAATGADATSAGNLATTNVIAFVTSSGLSGIIKVDALNVGVDGDITISIKVEEPAEE